MATVNSHHFEPGTPVRLKSGPDDIYTFRKLDPTEQSIAHVDDTDGNPTRINITNLIPASAAAPTGKGPQADVVAKIKAKVDEKRARLSIEDDEHTTGQEVDEAQQTNAKDDGPIWPKPTPDEPDDESDSDPATIADTATGTPMPADYNPAVAKAASGDIADTDTIEAESGEVEALQSEVNRLNAILEKREQTIATQTDKLTALQAPEVIECKTLVQPWDAPEKLVAHDGELAKMLNRGWHIIDITIYSRAANATTKHTRIVTLKRTPRRTPDRPTKRAQTTPDATAILTNPMPGNYSIINPDSQPGDTGTYNRALTSGLFSATELSTIGDAELILKTTRSRLDRQQAVQS